MSLMIRPDSGTKSRMANSTEVNKHIDELQHQLARSRAETQKVRDKLTCLISLVRRSWNGDRNASIHLANIVGLDVPNTMLDGGSAGRPGSRVNTESVSADTRAVKNWERMAVRLLQRDYMELQAEIQEHQQRYIENRSRFMDEVMHFHQKDMARLPLSRPTSGKLSSIDQQFLQHHSYVGPDGRNEQRRQVQRAKSAVITRRPKAANGDVVEQADVRLRDFFVDATQPPTMVTTATGDSGDVHPQNVVKEKGPLAVVGKRRYKQDYDDSSRYLQGNLFNAEELLTRKPRPVSAAVMLERDQQRSRPRSAVTLNMNANNNNTEVDDSRGDRPLKYETTRPVSGKKATGKIRKGSTVSAGTRRNSQPSPQHGTSTDTQHQLPPDSHRQRNNSFEEVANNPKDASQEPFVPPFEEDVENYVLDPRPPISVRVKNAITRPEHVDKFSEDLRHMEEMEEAFRKNTLVLQKKLGLPQNGIV